MRKFGFLASAAILVGFGLFISSCKKSHETPAKPKLSFAEATKTVKESDGSIDLTLTLDKPSPEAISITYTLGGTATDKVTAAQNSAYDYEVTTSYLETKIAKGQTTGVITILLASDFTVENDETIEVAIKDVDSQNIEITRNDSETITVQQEDGLGVFLEWGIGTGEHYTDVDMDLFLWAKGTASTDLVITNVGSATPGYVSPEFMFLPTALLPDGTYGLSCNYYEGAESPMNFVVSFVTLTNGVTGTPVTRNGSYTQANVNPWYTSGNNPLLVETFDKSGTTYQNFSAITVPASSSRTGALSPAISTMKKVQSGFAVSNKLLDQFLKKKK